MIMPKKLFDPKISSHNIFNGACSLSSIEIKIAPFLFNNFFAITSLSYINDSHLLCLKASSEFINLSSYTKSFFPLLYGGSI